MKHERKAQEKYWNFIQMIDEKRKTAGINKIKVSYFDFVQNPSIKSVETGTVLLERLERDKGIKILERPKLDHLNSAGENDFTIEVLPEFDGIFNREYKNYVAMADDFQADHSTIESFESRPIIKAKSLELIAKKIGDMDSGSNLVEILTNCGVKQELIEYPNTKWRMVYSVLFALATSSKLQDQEVLFKIIEEAAHPLMHNGDEKIAKLYEDELNNLLKYDNFALKKGKLKKIDQQSEQDDEYENDDDDAFSYDGGISSSYENTDLELFILKKILLEHKRRDDCGFFAKEFSFNNNSLEEICRTINKLIEDKILYLSANSRPERFENKEGIEDKRGFINWKMVERMDKNPQEMNKENGCVIFDVEIADEVKLKGRIDIAIEEFMNDKVYTPLGILMDKVEVNKILVSVKQEKRKRLKSAVEEAITPERISYPYYKQRAIIIDEISKDNKEELIIPLNNFRDKQVEVLKTLLALEKENLLRITELRSNPIYGKKNKFIGKWSVKDNPVAKIYTLKTQANKQEPMLLKIVEMPPLEFKESEQKQSFRKISLKSVQISYDDDEPVIKIGKQNVALPPYKNEHYFCQAVFEYKLKEPVSWDIIFDKMTGHSTVSGGRKPEPIRENWQKVNDTMKRINNRIKQVVNTDDDLFSWSEKMVIRNY